jgi:hypothetical protein
VKRTGDGSIIEFRSVVDAVHCAIEVQSGLAMDHRERRIRLGLVFVDADIVLHRGVDRGDCQDFLGPIVGWSVDVPRGQSPEPVWMLFFEVFPDLLIVV